MWREKLDNILLPADHNGSSRKRKSRALDYSPGATSEYHYSLQFESSRQENTYYGNHYHNNTSNREFYQNELKLEKSAYIRPQFDNDYQEYLNQSKLGYRFDNDYQHLSNFSPEPRSMGNTSYSLPPQHHPLPEIPAGQLIAVHSQPSQAGYAFDRSESYVDFPSPTPNSSFVGKPQAGYSFERSDSQVNFPSPTPNSHLVGKPQVGPISYDLVNLSNTNNPISLSSLDFARPTETFQQSIVQTSRISKGHETTVLKEENKLENRGILENDERIHVVRDTKVVDADIKIQPTLLAKDSSTERQANEKSKSRCGKSVLSVVSEKLWDGSLQLNSSVSVSAVAFFKSGEKMLDTNWYESVEVKGKVRLEAFEKYIQELPRSRTRGLMVISLYWKEGSSDSGLTGMKEVSNAYLKGQKVGFANLSTGVDIYICPRSDKIITILAKYGFFKGLAAIEDNHDSMIGCVVWKRNRPSSKSDSKEVEIKNTVLSDQNKTLENPTTKSNEKKNRHPGKSQNNVVNAFTLPSQECLDAEKPKSCLKNQNTVINVVDMELASSDDDDLPEYDFGKVSGFSLVQENKSSEAFVEQTKPMVQALHAQGINVSRNLEQHNISERKTNMYKSTKKNLFDDDDMPEWFPPGINKIPLPESIIPATAVPLKVHTFQNMSQGPPRPPLHSPLIRVPIPAPPRQDSFSYQTFSGSPMISPMQTRPYIPPQNSPRYSLGSTQNSPRYSLGSTPDHVMRPQFNSRRGQGP